MLKKIDDPAIRVVYAAVITVGIAYGVSIAVLSIHLTHVGIAKTAMGGLAAAFATGIVLGSLPAGRLVERVGPKRALVGALAGYAVCVALFPVLRSFAPLAVARVFDGAFSVVVWVGCETVLLARARADVKALVMSLYAMSLALGYAVGPLLAKAILRVGTTDHAFFAAGALAAVAAAVALAGVPSGLHAAHGPKAGAAGDGVPAAPSTTPARTVASRVKTSCFATFGYGYFQSSCVLFLPLYLVEEKAIAESDTVLVTAFFAGGMLIASTIVARVADAVGHLRTMRVLGLVGGATVASFVPLASFPAMCAAVFLAGATLATISPVSLALQGVVTPEADLARANGFYNAAYALGMLVGPPVSSVLFQAHGGAAMLLHLAALWAAFVVFTLVFAGDDPRSATPVLRAWRERGRRHLVEPAS